MELLSDCRLAETQQGELCTLTAAPCVGHNAAVGLSSAGAKALCPPHSLLCAAARGFLLRRSALAPLSCHGLDTMMSLSWSVLAKEAPTGLHLLPPHAAGHMMSRDGCRRIALLPIVDASSFTGSGLSEDRKDVRYADQASASIFILLCRNALSSWWSQAPIGHVLCSLISDLQRKVDTASLKIILAFWKEASHRWATLMQLKLS